MDYINVKRVVHGFFFTSRPRKVVAVVVLRDSCREHIGSDDDTCQELSDVRGVLEHEEPHGCVTRSAQHVC